ncbi:alanine--tRNA ligase-related protein, partial [Acinetobacter baumannii]
EATTNDIINGKSVFELFDTFGFPLDLTKLIAAEKNLQIDEAGFAVEMQQQKNRSRAAATLDTEDWIVVNEEKEEGFVGYENNLIQTRVNKYRKISA